jgi:hypothetical protein
MTHVGAGITVAGINIGTEHRYCVLEHSNVPCVFLREFHGVYGPSESEFRVIIGHPVPPRLPTKACKTVSNLFSINFPLHHNHMESHTHDKKGASISLSHSLSDPEDDDSSGVESFDEDDIYDGLENGDDVIYQIPDSEAHSPVDGMVCPPLHPRSPDFSYL